MVKRERGKERESLREHKKKNGQRARLVSARQKEGLVDERLSPTCGEEDEGIHFVRD